MNTTAKTAMIAFVMFVAGLSIGADRTPDEYDRACQNMLAEKESFEAFILAQKYGGRIQPVNQQTFESSAKRLNHWLAIMEKFKP